MAEAKDRKVTISCSCQTCQSKIIADIKINWGSSLWPRVQCANCQQIFDVKLTDDDGYPFINLLPIHTEIGQKV